MTVLTIRERLEDEGVSEDTIAEVAQEVRDAITSGYMDGYGTGYLHAREQYSYDPSGAWHTSMTHAQALRDYHIEHHYPDH